MALSNDLISQFVKITQDNKETKKETSAYGKIVKQGDVEYIQLDGSDLLTPISSTTVVNDGDRVLVTIKNHTAIVTGNLTDKSASNSEVRELGNTINEFEIIISDKVVTEDLEVINGYIENIKAITGKYSELSAITAEIETLQAKYASLDHVSAKDIEALNAEIETLRGKFGEFTEITTEDLEAIDAEFDNLSAYNATFVYVSAEVLEALKAEISELSVKKLDAETAKITYATIDFSNIQEAAIEKLFADSGIIKDLIMKDGNVTGELVGVTIKGDLIEGNTVKADKLVIRGTDGLYYKLNVDSLGEATTSSDEKYQNGLDGSVIIAKSITADRISVTDLVAFGATIGGFHINDHSLYSGVKSSVDNITEGIFLSDDGQVNIGNTDNFFKFFKDENGEYKLEISADNIYFGSEKRTVESLYESVKSNTEDLTKYIETTNEELEHLQGQIDGSIMTWFYEYVPTNENIPASEWTTTDLKNNHLGDLFYDTITGYCYRWQVLNNEYSWNRITDVDVTKALSDAKKAQDTADCKRRTFVDTPTPPYDVGDLWVQGVTGDIMRCQTAKTKDQSYASSDWVKASKYTDDSAAEAVSERVTVAETKIVKNAEAIELRATKAEVTEQIDSIEVGGRNYALNTAGEDYIQSYGETNKDGLYHNLSDSFQNCFGEENYTISGSFKFQPQNEVEASGISINDAKEGLVDSLIIHGKCTQEAIIEENIFDGELKLNTINADGASAINANNSQSTNYIPVESDTTYTISSSIACKIGLRYYDENKTYIGYGASLASPNTFTTPSNCKFLKFVLENMNDLTAEIILVPGTSIPEKPQPSPEKPIEIETIVGIENLFNDELEIGSISGTGVNETISNYVRNVNYISVEAGVEYTVSSDIPGRIALRFYDENKTFLQSGTTLYGPNTFTVPDNASYLRIILVGHNDLTAKVQLEKGNIANIYASYGDKYVGIKRSGKNLLKYTSVVKENIGTSLTLTIADDGLITLNGTASSNWWPDLVWDIRYNTVNHTSCVYHFPKTLDSVTASFIEVGGTASRNDLTMSIVFNDNSNTSVGVRPTRLTQTKQNVYGINRAYLYIASGDVFDNYQFYIMLEEGDTASQEYEPYKEELYFTPLGDYELCSIGDVKDELDLETGVLTKRIGKAILDGTQETYVYVEDDENTTRIAMYRALDGKGGKTDDTTLYCNRLKGILNWSPDIEGIYINNLAVVFRINKSIIGTTKDEVLAWLSANPLVVYYELATPEEINLSNIELSLYEGSNYITSNVDLKMLYDQNSMANNNGGTFNFQGNGELYEIDSSKWNISDLSIDEYKRLNFTSKLTDSDLDTDLIGVMTNNMKGKLYLKEFKAEKGNKATDYEDAPEVVDVKLTEISTRMSSLEATAEGIVATVSNIESFQTTTEESLAGINTELETLSKSVSASMTEEQISLQIQSELSKGSSKVTTNTGYTFDDEGLTISKTGSEMTTQITEDGMTVKRDDVEVLNANNNGVIAYNLHAKTYLIIGETSRFEEFVKDGKTRVGCFWIGETEVE